MWTACDSGSSSANLGEAGLGGGGSGPGDLLDDLDASGSGSGKLDAGGKADVANVPEVSCVGVNVPQSTRDLAEECAFLAECPHLGKCYCGPTCETDKVTCTEAICKGIDTTCFCGKGCAPGVTQCGLKVCGAEQDAMGCVEHGTCLFHPAIPPPECNCQVVPKPPKTSGCYCSLCGLHNGKPMCFYSVCVTGK